MTYPPNAPAPKVRARILLPALFATVLLVPCVSGAREATPESPKPAKLFASDDTLTVTIRASWKTLLAETDNRRPYPGSIAYTDELGTAVSLPLTVERRGVKRAEYCRFPPVKLHFDKKNVKGTTFRGQKSLKLVTHCESGSAYEQYYVVEMLIYRMYRQLTDYSFRVRPLEVVYHDSERDKADRPRFAFLIEDDSDVAKRQGMKPLNVSSTHYRQMEPHLTSVFSLFQYMIGNVDWAALKGPDPERCCHNVKLLAREPPGADDWIYLVPYDFDSSGLVDAEYAGVPRGLSIREVTERLYRGYCWHDDTLDEARNLLLGKESAIMALAENEERLTSRTRRRVKAYLANSYEVIRDTSRFDDEIRSRCRGKYKSD